MRRTLICWLSRPKHKAGRKTAQQDLDKKLDAKYPKLTEAEIKTLVVDDKWMARVSATVQGELDRVSQTLTARLVKSRVVCKSEGKLLDASVRLPWRPPWVREA